jgi:hypothetical protein
MYREEKEALMLEKFAPVMRVWSMMKLLEVSSVRANGQKRLGDFAEVTPFSIKLQNPIDRGWTEICVVCDSVFHKKCRITLQNQHVSKTEVSVTKALDSIGAYASAYEVTRKSAAWRVMASVIREEYDKETEELTTDLANTFAPLDGFGDNPPKT